MPNFKSGDHVQGADLDCNTRCKTKEQVQQQMPRLVGPLLLTWKSILSISGPVGPAACQVCSPPA